MSGTCGLIHRVRDIINDTQQVIQLTRSLLNSKPQYARSIHRTVRSVAAEAGNLQILDWLRDEVGITAQDLREGNCEMLRGAIAGGRTSVLDWMLLLDPTFIEKIEQYRFMTLKHAAIHGDLSVLKWMQTRNMISSSDCKPPYSDILNLATLYGRQSVLDWLAFNRYI
jgi:hypothetical protein